MESTSQQQNKRMRRGSHSRTSASTRVTHALNTAPRTSYRTARLSQTGARRLRAPPSGVRSIRQSGVYTLNCIPGAIVVCQHIITVQDAIVVCQSTVIVRNPNGVCQRMVTIQSTIVMCDGTFTVRNYYCVPVPLLFRMQLLCARVPLLLEILMVYTSAWLLYRVPLLCAMVPLLFGIPLLCAIVT